MQIKRKAWLNPIEIVGLIFIVIFTAVILLPWVRGYTGVIFYPQYSSVSKDQNNPIVNLSQIRPLLLGANQISIEIKHNSGSLVFSFDENDLHDAKDTPLALEEANVTFNIGSTNFHTDADCFLDAFKPEKISILYTTDKFSQGVKYLRLKMDIQIAEITATAEINCISDVSKNVEIPIILRNTVIPFDIETNVIYKWSSKGGKTYRI